jgi:hypothetical protein
LSEGEFMAEESARAATKGLPEVKDRSSEQTGAKTRNCGPEEHGNESRCLRMIVMMSPVVALAASKVRR